MAEERRIDSGTALITGASGGIGEELARLFAQDGFDVVLVARSERKLQALADELSAKYKVRARALAVDLAKDRAGEEILAALRPSSTDVDILVNNAGFGLYGRFAELDLEEQLSMVRLNVTTLTHLTGLFLPGMIARRSGRILNVASTAAFQPGPMMAVYFAGKAYVLSFSEAIANELKGTGVTVTCLCPGGTHTGFHARAAPGRPPPIRLRNMMDAATVARIGYRAMKNGKPLVIAGKLNRFLVQTLRLAPRRFVTSMVRKIQEDSTR